jgi:hypothetical protein
MSIAETISAMLNYEGAALRKKSTITLKRCRILKPMPKEKKG